MKLHVNPKRLVGQRNPMLYGHFIEHFHRQIYDGIYDPENSLSDEDGFRTDIIDAMKKIKVPILRWPGGCFVSSYHWKDAVGKTDSHFSIKHGVSKIPTLLGQMNILKCAKRLVANHIFAQMQALEQRRR